MIALELARRRMKIEQISGSIIYQYIYEGCSKSFKTVALILLIVDMFPNF